MAAQRVPVNSAEMVVSPHHGPGETFHDDAPRKLGQPVGRRPTDAVKNALAGDGPAGLTL